MCSFFMMRGHTHHIWDIGGGGSDLSPLILLSTLISLISFLLRLLPLGFSLDVDLLACCLFTFLASLNSPNSIWHVACF